jgi:hypothetical protein
MSANEILSLIDSEIAALQQARALLAGGVAKKKPGRPKSTAVSVVHNGLDPQTEEETEAESRSSREDCCRTAEALGSSTEGCEIGKERKTRPRYFMG